MNRDGLVDKYEGDLIMAEWGVPFPRKDHAVQACLAALEQQESMRALRPVLKNRFGHDIYTRTGINTGTVIAGNMGSDRRFNYTVLGDAVNLASRFEPANKDYQTEIIIGEATYLAAKESIHARLLDMIVVQGISRPVRIYELLCRLGGLTETKASVVDLYQTALRAYWQRDWDRAIMYLDQALRIDDKDFPSLSLRRRVERYRNQPPGVEWQGEYVRLTKD